MPESVKLEKAELRQLDAEFKNEIKPEKTCKVQFNPESLKVAFANQIQTPQGAGDQSGTPARQFVGAGTTKLTLQLWFDVTQPMPEGEESVNDVRKLTQKVAYFITPVQEGRQFVPPAVRFVWGSFQFDGLMESLEESLEFFSAEGRPLRASMVLNLSQQKITEFTIKDVAAANVQTPGTRPLTPAPANESLQSMADKQGKGGDWQSIAAANNIENPRLLAPGQLIDMNASASAGAPFGAGVSGSAGFGVVGQVGFGAGASLSAGASVAGGVSASGGAPTQFGAGVSAGAGGSIGAGDLVR
jgi:Contractile injection system tube protein/LysM domain